MVLKVGGGVIKELSLSLSIPLTRARTYVRLSPPCNATIKDEWTSVTTPHIPL
jgi:hypothetical protein